MKLRTLQFRFRPVTGYQTYPFYINLLGQVNPTNACGASLENLVYGKEPIFQNNTIFYFDNKGTTIFTHGGGSSNWFSNGLKAIQINNDGTVIAGSLQTCSTPTTRYSFFTNLGHTTSTDACSATPQWYLEGYSSTFTSNTFFFIGESETILTGGGSYFAYGGNFVRVNGGTVVQTGTCPTPAPVTPAPTTAPTPAPTISCNNYQVYNSDLALQLEFSYTSCGGTPQNGVLDPDETSSIFCAQTGTVSITSGTGTITDLGSCSTPAPTVAPTPAPSSTPAPTTSCTNYDVYNSDLGIELEFSYISCAGTLQNVTVGPDETSSVVCAQTGTISITSGTGTINSYGSCITPSP